MYVFTSRFCQSVLMVSWCWWVELTRVKAELRFAETIVMALYVTIAGMIKMQVLSADNLVLMVTRNCTSHV